ncbi:MAG: dTDP-4-dehydrorhamnose reductase [Alphaproteobacteria bacterium]|nr:dTDP-4-dehydrorhamnose reductase [Alphaproteobacteria bacterium]
MSKKSVLLLGASGQLGLKLRRVLSDIVDVVVPDRKTADFSAPQNLVSVTRNVAPNLIVNAAAYTAVDRAEEEEQQAIEINTIAPGVLANEAQRMGIPLIHYSTDFVFDGFSDRPYLESDESAPLNVYGRSKRDGEIAIQESGAAHLIFRTSWIYAQHGRNFLQTMERLFLECDEVTVVDDQIGTPTSARSLAEATASIIRMGLDTPELYREKSGTYHVTGAGEISWHGFASRYFAARQSQGVSYRCKAVMPISTDGYPTPARRPAYSVLNSSKLERTFGVKLPSWETQLAGFLDDISDEGERG